jgi:hypothetical protein
MASDFLANIMRDFGINYIMKNLYILLIAVFITGCSSQKMVKLPDNKGTIPEWFATEPEKQGSDIIVTATDTSRDMQFAIDKAMLQARVEMANRIGVRIDSLVRESVREDSGSKMKDVDREVDRVSKQVTNQMLSMYTREKLTVMKEDGGFRAFVMLKISEDQSRKLFELNRKNPKNREEQFKELDSYISR